MLVELKQPLDQQLPTATKLLQLAVGKRARDFRATDVVKYTEVIHGLDEVARIERVRWQERLPKPGGLKELLLVHYVKLRLRGLDAVIHSL